jgi:hypothetical protein
MSLVRCAWVFPLDGLGPDDGGDAGMVSADGGDAPNAVVDAEGGVGGEPDARGTSDGGLSDVVVGLDAGGDALPDPGIPCPGVGACAPPYLCCLNTQGMDYVGNCRPTCATSEIAVVCANSLECGGRSCCFGPFGSGATTTSSCGARCEISRAILCNPARGNSECPGASTCKPLPQSSGFSFYYACY